jgi:rSAM/selenodomain-associated transferase 1
MTKVPVAGRVKTRLAAELGVAAAVRCARACTGAVLRRLASDARWQTTVALTPDGARRSPAWPRRPAVEPQGRGDLGARMQRILDRAGPGPVAIVGTDVPQIVPEHIAAAFRLLGRNAAVLGPAPDGGYWLIGLRRRPHVLRPFGGVRWSGPHALADTAANLGGHRVARAAVLPDIDTPADLARCAASVGRVVPPRS